MPTSVLGLVNTIILGTRGLKEGAAVAERGEKEIREDLDEASSLTQIL